jgi:hypothetical protein
VFVGRVCYGRLELGHDQKRHNGAVDKCMNRTLLQLLDRIDLPFAGALTGTTYYTLCMWSVEHFETVEVTSL